jgi:MFS transporter, SP family, arabinose:H+ symporter
MSAAGRNAYVFAIAFVASVGGFLFGYDLAIMGAANVYLREEFELSDAAFGLATASAALGCAAGPILGGWVCDRIGRRRTLILAALLIGANAVCTALARDMITFNVFRIIGGVGVGLCSIASPLYIAEVSPPRRRGALGFMFQLAIVVGCVLSLVVGYELATGLPEATSWRWMFGSQAVVVLLFLVFLGMIPETPRWLAARGSEDEAMAVLERVGGPEYAREQMREIRVSLTAESGTFGELFEPRIRKALAVGILLALFNNYTGWSGMYNYLPTIFKQGGFPETTDALFYYMVAYSFMGVMTLLACFAVDRVGRRPLWLAGSALMIFANALMGLLFHVGMGGGWILLAVMLMAIPHSFALGPLPWLMMSELYPTRIRARAVAITTTALWALAFFPVMLFPVLQRLSERTIGSGAGVFWVNAVICVGALAFGWRLLPETKGRTLEDIARS